MNNRRQFLKTLSAAALAPWVAAQTKMSVTRAKIPLAFSTLGCPAWEWKKILDFATQHGFSAIELRGIEGKLDLPALPLFAADRIEQTKQDIRASKLRIACVSSSAQMYVEDPAKAGRKSWRTHAASSIWHLPSERHTCASLAARRNLTRVLCPAMRQGASRRRFARTRQIRWPAQRDGHHRIARPFHGVCNLEECAAIGRFRTRWPALGRASHLCHLERRSRIYRSQLGSWIRHTHLKDSIGSGEDRKYVLTGRGNVPIQRQIEALRSIGYKGFYCFEWEKLWHPDIDDPEVAIADYARVVGQCLGNARACGQ